MQLPKRAGPNLGDMAISNYDVNLHLALATTAEQEGDVLGALDFLAAAQRLARGTDLITRTRLFLQSARLRLRVPAFRAL